MRFDSLLDNNALDGIQPSDGSWRCIVRKTFILAVALIVGLAIPASAQLTRGTISGTVKDSGSGVVPGATVILTDQARGTNFAPVTTNDTGDFVFPDVATGTYTVE